MPRRAPAHHTAPGSNWASWALGHNGHGGLGAHTALGMIRAHGTGHSALGTGHWALDTRPWALGTGHRAPGTGQLGTAAHQGQRVCAGRGRPARDTVGGAACDGERVARRRVCGDRCRAPRGEQRDAARVLSCSCGRPHALGAGSIRRRIRRLGSRPRLGSDPSHPGTPFRRAKPVHGRLLVTGLGVAPPAAPR